MANQVLDTTTSSQVSTTFKYYNKVAEAMLKGNIINLLE